MRESPEESPFSSPGLASDCLPGRTIGIASAPFCGSDDGDLICFESSCFSGGAAGAGAAGAGGAVGCVVGVAALSPTFFAAS